MRKETKILVIICFILILSAFVTALVSDAIIVGRSILGFAFALFAAVFVFLLGIILMVISIMFVFGIYLLEDRGFWPIEWSRTAYQEIIKDYQITESQINALTTIRIILLVICIFVFIVSIIAINHLKKVKKMDPTIKRKPISGFAITSLVLSILGILVASGVLSIVLIIL